MYGKSAQPWGCTCHATRGSLQATNMGGQKQATANMCIQMYTYII